VTKCGGITHLGEEHVLGVKHLSSISGGFQGFKLLGIPIYIPPQGMM